MALPGVALVCLSVLVMLKSAVGVTVVVSVLLLLEEVGSVTPVGAATVAVLVMVPVAVELTVPDKVKVAL